MLFADLVGFTTQSEDEDPEAVREFLSRYFDTAREVIGRYGGTIEKFIGDAVMAVWGAPTAQEDDAERAVRAGMELVAAVDRLEGSTNDARPQVRVGVLTGEAAVTIGASGEGMVAGDLVNTASRLQAIAAPGTVLVGETTQRAAQDAIAFESLGEQSLKGKDHPVAVWRAIRVVAQRRGAGRSERLEAPFIGRDEELRLVKDLFHATEREHKLRLLSIVGQAGIGKSRLLWEFLKYVDGLIEDVFWHHGRSPAYGEGITFWALGEMVRTRARIAESDDEATTRERLASALEDFVPIAEERRWMEPRLAALLGLEETPVGEREQLYAAWRIFFERVSDRGPAVLVFDDLQWADNGLIDFIEHLLEWARPRPILIITLARPELLERRPNWGAGQHSFTSLHLEPLKDAEVGGMLTGLAPGLPESAVRAVLARAEGVPLYAVETIRMLVDQGRLVPEGESYRLTQSIEELAIPETLHALIAARLDGLEPEERALVQNAAVIGQSFTLRALAYLTGDDEDQLQTRLKALVRKEFLRLEVDAFSPERGQYQFVQELIKEIAYSTLARADRRSRHLAAARFFEELGDEELAGVLASHYLDAYKATPRGPEADALAAQARVALRAAAERAAALHSHDQALAYLEQALIVTTAPAAQAAIWEQAAESAAAVVRKDVAQAYLLRAIEWYRTQDDRPAAARVMARLGGVLLETGKVEEAIAQLEGALADLAEIKSDPEVVRLTAELARAYMFHEEWERCLETSDRALIAAEAMGLSAVIAEALTTKAAVFSLSGRPQESLAILTGAIALSETRGLVGTELRARNNLAFLLGYDDPWRGLTTARAGVDLARRNGQRKWVLMHANNALDSAFYVGEWDWALKEFEEFDAADLSEGDRFLLLPRLWIQAFRSDPAPVEQLLESWQAEARSSTDPQTQAYYTLSLAIAAFANGDLENTYRLAIRAANASTQTPLRFPGLVLAGHAVLFMEDRLRLADALQELDGAPAQPGRIALSRRTLAAGLAALEGKRDEAAAAYQDIAREWREMNILFDLALSQLEFVTLVGPDRPETAAAADEAREIFGRLGARPLLERLDTASGFLTASPAISRKAPDVVGTP